MLGQNKEFQDKARGRQVFTHKGQEVYEWDQTIDDINIYIKPPPALLPKNQETLKKQLMPGEPLPKLEVKIKSNHVAVGVKGIKPFIDEDLTNLCVESESLWMIEDDELHIQLQKSLKAEVWGCVFKGHNALDPLAKQEVQKKLLLERFQEENPGFDFSGADFNGLPPDPRTFMGGVKHS